MTRDGALPWHTRYRATPPPPPRPNPPRPNPPRPPPARLSSSLEVTLLPPWTYIIILDCQLHASRSCGHGPIYTQSTNHVAMDLYTHNQQIMWPWTYIHTINKSCRHGPIYTQSTNHVAMDLYTHNQQIMSTWTYIHTINKSCDHGPIYTQSTNQKKARYDFHKLCIFFNSFSNFFSRSWHEGDLTQDFGIARIVRMCSWRRLFSLIPKAKYLSQNSLWCTMEAVVSQDLRRCLQSWSMQNS